MYNVLATQPIWQRRARRRLLASTALAAVLIAALIGLVGTVEREQTQQEIAVRLLPAEPQAMIDPPTPLQPIEVPQPVVREKLEIEPVPSTDTPNDKPETPTDWYADMQTVAKSVVASELTPESVNPVFDAKRREAAIKFAPSRAPVKKPIWENVETDQIGRKVLVSGNCQRVIDETRVTQLEAFETFYQYLTTCWNFKREPKNLPWVDDVRDRHAYLGGGADHVIEDDRPISNAPIPVAEVRSGNWFSTPNVISNLIP